MEKRIEETYAKASNAGLNKSLYDAYIKAFRWSSDRLDPKNGGVICFVSNGAWVDGNSTDGFRHCLEKEFSAIYVFNLRGNQRTSGELSRKEGGKIFASGSRTPISITLLVKKSDHSGKAQIYYHDIGDYLNREDRLDIVKKAGSVTNPTMHWQVLSPNEHNDWINHRNDKFGDFIPLAPNKKFDAEAKSVFTTYSLGIATNRDSWVYNYSKRKVAKQMKEMINFYNAQVKSYQEIQEINTQTNIEKFIDTNPAKISWTVNLKKDIERGIIIQNEGEMLIGMYRPFTCQQLFFNKHFIERPGLSKKIFPLPNIDNLVIALSGMGASKDFSAIITNKIPDLQLMFNGQCFPLYWYEETKQEKTLFDSLAEPENEFYARRDAISDFALNQARKQYGSKTTKEDIFYYVYGFLHNPDYRTEFAADLKKMLPRIPFVDGSTIFWKYVKAGRELAELHLHYENAEKYPGVIEMYNPLTVVDTLKQMSSDEMEYLNYRVDKMRFLSKTDKSKIIYNSQITIENIPAGAYEYVVNGRSAIEWIMECYQVKTHKESGIVNNPNDWAREHNKPRYILDLLLSIITVSVNTVEIVKGLPKVEF